MIIRKLKTAARLFKHGGMAAVKGRIRQNKENKKINLVNGYHFIMNREKTPFSPEDYKKLQKEEKLVLNWVIPLPGIGSGGHINIFRFICNLQNMGFQNRVYAMNGDESTPQKEFYDFVEKYYGVTDKTLELYYGTKNMKAAHASIATSWETAYVVNNFDNTVSKFYFVQDFEPYFFPLGSRYSFAENTYKFGFRGITAGYWLKDKLREEYGMETEGFGFSYDRNIYSLRKKKDTTSRVFYYARPFTERRSFEMGLLVLSELHRQMPEVEIVMAGSSLEEYEISFPYIDLGTVALEELSELYAQCDLCLVLSHTNLSLLPLEIMASGSVVVCNRGANSEWLVNETNSVMTDADPVDIVEKMLYFLTHKEQLEKKRKSGQAFAEKTSWVKEAEKVAKFVKKGIAEDEKGISFRG